MTVPEENRPKTSTTDQVIESADTGDEQQQPGASGRSMREAMEEAGITPDDFEE